MIEDYIQKLDEIKVKEQNLLSSLNDVKKERLKILEQAVVNGLGLNIGDKFEFLEEDIESPRYGKTYQMVDKNAYQQLSKNGKLNNKVKIHSFNEMRLQSKIRKSEE